MNQTNQTKRFKIGCALVLVVFLIFVIYFIYVASKPTSKPAPIIPPSSNDELKASVQFNGTQFIITNLDNYNWIDVKLELNGRLINDGYVLKTDMIKAGAIYTVGSMQFAKSDGTRFNPFTMKPQNIAITAKMQSGQLGIYTAGWK